MIRALRIFAVTWGAGATAVIAIGLGTIWYMHGFAALRDVMSPYNLREFVAVMLAYSPAVAANVLAEKLKAAQAK